MSDVTWTIQPYGDKLLAIRDHRFPIVARKAGAQGAVTGTDLVDVCRAAAEQESTAALAAP